MKSFIIRILLPAILASGSISCINNSNSRAFRSAIFIPSRGNSWITSNYAENKNMITDEGINDWADPETIIETYFRIKMPGMIRIALIAKVPEGKSKVEYTFAGKSKRVSVSGSAADTIDLGTFTAPDSGYVSLKLRGLERSGPVFCDIPGILITGQVTEEKVWYVKDDFYFGRRGPSVHLRYEIPQNAGDIVWFYNEITVPDGNDIPGSYFMADGFTDGYFGMQVNSPSERRILFSVWSPFKTNNPQSIPDDYKIIMLKKGPEVHTGEFGNEGSGGQSYLKYMWKAGTTYRFLLKGEPSNNNSTDYKAYFYAPELEKWQLIAAFRRPKGSKYLGSLYSFLENFIPETGALTRKGLWSNQWVCNKKGKWSELTGIKFTADATARKGARLDYSGGVEENSFFLKNCGFFSKKTEMNSEFSRIPTGNIPDVNLNELE